MTAADSTPQPEIASRLGASARTKTSSSFLQRGDLGVELSAALQQVASQPSNDPLKVIHLREQPTQHVLVAQTPTGHLQIRIELVQMPAHLRGDPGALLDQVPAVITQQFHLPGRAIQLRDRQPRMT